MIRFLIHAVAIALLTLLTQLGGVAWLAAQRFKPHVTAFVIAYATLSLSALWVAPVFGRVALSCWEDGPLQVQSWVYCALNRNYVTPETASVLSETANAVNQRFPGTITLVLDANFPFFEGFPLLPHLSHDDGEKADLAFYYREGDEYLPSATRSPIGYFAFEEGQTNCPQVWPTLRWDFHALQPIWSDYELDEMRTRYVLSLLSQDPRVGKIFIEPHLKSRFGLSDDKIRFQGCNAARHDDHIHMQLG